MRLEDSERLIRVGPGTPAGALFRRYWQPPALASEFRAMMNWNPLRKPAWP